MRTASIDNGLGAMAIVYLALQQYCGSMLIEIADRVKTALGSLNVPCYGTINMELCQ